MTVRGAVLRAMGLPAPYAQSQPLRIEERGYEIEHVT